MPAAAGYVPDPATKFSESAQCGNHEQALWTSGSGLSI
jgi:hypothetical protein